MSQNFKTKGFSLLELLIVISILVALTTGGTGFYQNFMRDVEIKTVARTISADLRTARAKSMARTDDLKWGIRFVNTSTASHYYEIFSTPTDYTSASKSVSATTTLSKGITFSDPSSDTTRDIIFYKVAGTTTASSVGVISTSGGTQTVTVSALGTIY